MNLRFLLTFVVSFCIGSQILQAETNNTATVSGNLFDSQTKEAVELVNVTLYKNESTKPYQVKVTKEDGSFSFTGVTPGIYRLETKLLGYASYQQKVDVSTGSEKILGKIFLKTDSKLLKSVEVTGIRSNMKMEIDKKTYSVDQSIAAAGASASDILKDIPSVAVDAEGTISLRNSESVTVWINGKPSGLTSDNRGQVLEQMPAENIDRIEVVTNPSAKFSPEGSAGIINIILKKERKSGYYGSLNAGLSSPWGQNFGANINYSSTKLDAYANIGYRNDEHVGDGINKRQTYKTDNLTGIIDTSYLNTESNRTNGGNGLFTRAGIDYHLNKKHTISLSGFAMDGSHNSDSKIAYNYLNNDGDLTRQSIRNSVSDATHNNYEITMDYQWEISKDENLQASISRGNRSDDDSNSYSQTDYNTSHVATGSSYQKQDGPSSSKDWEMKVDYSKKFSERWKVEAGMESEIENKYSENNIYNGIPSGNGYTLPTIPDFSNGFDYDEQIHAVYSTLTGKLGPKFGYQVGLRGEETIVSFVSTNGTESTKIDKDYFKIFPTIFLNYNLSEGNDIQLNYSKRINRPRGRFINPFIDISDSTNIRTGNPDLNPEYAHAFELNYMKTWKSHMLSTSLYHRITNDVIQDIRYLDDNGVMYQKPSNVTNSTNSGFEFVAKDRLCKILETTTTLNLYYSTMDAFTYNNLNYEGTNGFSWNARLNGNLMLPKGITGQISGFYSAPRIIAQGEMKSSYSLDFGLRKSFMDGKLQLSMNARNLLDSFKMESSTWGQGFHQESSNHFFGRDFRFNVTWNFGNLKPKHKPGKENNNSENSMDTGGEY
jgi:Outer membrane receptor proteins, mostly Fe transport